MAGLRRLNLNSNKLDGLPELEGLVSLEELTLTKNHLTALPASIGTLQNLRKFEFMYNKIEGDVLPVIRISLVTVVCVCRAASSDM